MRKRIAFMVLIVGALLIAGCFDGPTQPVKEDKPSDVFMYPNDTTMVVVNIDSLSGR